MGKLKGELLIALAIVLLSVSVAFVAQLLTQEEKEMIMGMSLIPLEVWFGLSTFIS